MKGQIIHNLPNEEYHNGEPWREYVSSSDLKHYLCSPKAFRYAQDHPTEQTDAMRFGSLFHDLMECLAAANGQWAQGYEAWLGGLARFNPPINERTGQPYGATTKAYTEAYSRFLADNEGKTTVNATDSDLASDMAHSLLNDCGSTSEQVRKLLKWGEPEVSIFYESEDGIKLKIRPDLLTKSKIIDWKSVATDDLSEESINRIILRYGYHISAAMYQYVAHEVLNKWLDFYLVLVSKLAPYDAVMVNMSAVVTDEYGNVEYGYGYCHDREAEIVIPGCGAVEFQKLLGLHKECHTKNEYPGSEIFINGGRYRILDILPPRYYANKFQ